MKDRNLGIRLSLVSQVQKSYKTAAMPWKEEKIIWRTKKCKPMGGGELYKV